MADLGSLEDIWRQSLALNIRYYSALSRLSVDYVKDLIAVLGELRQAVPQPPTPQAQHTPPNSTAGTQPVASLTPAPQPAGIAPAQQAGVMVLESETGGQALGVFLIANNLGHDISARVTASPFVDANGHAIQPAFFFDPDVITLAPAEQLLVRVVAAIDDSFESDVRYRGEFAIPELSGTRIPIVMRRRPSPPETLAETRATPANEPKSARAVGRRRATKAKLSGTGVEPSGESKMVEPFSRPIFDEALNVMSAYLPPDARVLDAGCGPGRELQRVARLVPQGEVVGIDLAAGMVLTAHRAARACGLDNCAFFQSDVGDLPAVFTGEFDVVYNCLAAMRPMCCRLNRCSATPRVSACARRC